MSKRRIKQSVLVFSAALMVLMTGLVMVVLWNNEEPAGPATEAPATVSPATTPATPARRSASDRRPAREPAPATSASRATPPAPAAAPDATVSARPPVARPVQRVPTARRVAAPPPQPPSIEAEKDPVKRQELRRMHRLAYAETRVRLLGRRSRMLRDTLSRARQNKTWSADRLRKEVAGLERLEATVAATKKEIVQLKKQLKIRP